MIVYNLKLRASIAMKVLYICYPQKYKDLI